MNGKQLSVLPSISSVGKSARDSRWGGNEDTERKKNDATKMDLNDSPGELLIQSGGDCIQGLDKTEGQVFENP